MEQNVQAKAAYDQFLKAVKEADPQTHTEIFTDFKIVTSNRLKEEVVIQKEKEAKAGNEIKGIEEYMKNHNLV